MLQEAKKVPAKAAAAAQKDVFGAIEEADLLIRKKSDKAGPAFATATQKLDALVASLA